MNPDHHRRLAAWFEEASRLQGAGRDEFFARCQAEDAALSAELSELLAHDTPGADAFSAGGVAVLARDVLGSAARAAAGAREDDADRSVREGDRVGPYTVTRRLGAGGFAVVYLAHQDEPVTRDVALKLLRPGMDSKHVLARFAAELQAQARMSHEHVARVFDAGSTPEGRPYMAMELVDGEPITDWCAARRLGLEQRLELLIQAAGAVQHAHQKGVIHRDLKPSNVLVTEGPSTGSVKIIDFGIAKAIQGTLTGDSLLTVEGQLIGTPDYMSPEQAGLRGDDVDTRTDVYSLGVLLYELLVGLRPFAFETASLYEIQRTIHEVDPPRPSTRLLAANGAEGARVRRAIAEEPRGLARRLRGDLDWIVMRALEKDRARRYPTVAALSEDVQRYLRDEPVEASPPTTAYLVRKFVRRHRGGVLAAGVVATALVVGIVWAVIERGRADAATRAESLAKVDAQARANELQTVSDFQQAQFLGLDPEAIGQRIRQSTLEEAGSAMERALYSPEEIAARTMELDGLLRGANFTDVARDTLDSTFLRRSSAALREQFPDQPRVEALLLESLGATYTQLGFHEAAAAAFERVVELYGDAPGDDELAALGSRIQMAGAHRQLGHVERAAVELDELIARLRRPDSDAPELLASALSSRAQCALDRGDRSGALALREEAYEMLRSRLGAEHVQTYRAQALLARSVADPALSESHYLAAIAGLRQALGPEAATVLETEEEYASSLSQHGRTREAREIRERTYATFRRVLGDDHPATLISVEGLGLMLWRAGELSESERFLQRNHDGHLRAFGPDHPGTLKAAGDHAMLLSLLGRNAEAAPRYEAALAGMRAVLGLEHTDTLGTLTNLALSYAELGRIEDSARCLEEAVPVMRRVLGVQHAYTTNAIQALAKSYDALGRADEARPLWSERIELAVALGESPGATADQAGLAAELLFLVPHPELRDPARARPLAERAVALEREFGGASLYTQLSRLAVLQSMDGDPRAALATQQESVATAPPDAVELMRSYEAHYQRRVDGLEEPE